MSAQVGYPAYSARGFVILRDGEAERDFPIQPGRRRSMIIYTVSQHGKPLSGR